MKIHLCALPQLMSSSIHFWVKVKWNVCSTQEKQNHVRTIWNISLFAILTSKQVVAAPLFSFLLRIKTRIHAGYASSKKVGLLCHLYCRKIFVTIVLHERLPRLKSSFCSLPSKLALRLQNLTFWANTIFAYQILQSVLSFFLPIG